MAGFPCPTCGEEMVERFAKPKKPTPRPPVVRQCQKCWCVFLTEDMQEALSLPKRLQQLEAVETGGRRCPICEREMKMLKLRAGGSLFKKVELDRCPACRGVLFDPGELPETLGRTVSIAADKQDEYLKKNPRRVPSAMGDPAGPWSASSDGVSDWDPAALMDLFSNDD